MIPRVPSFLLVLLAALPVWAGVYRCPDSEGQPVITDRPCADSHDLEKTMPHAGVKPVAAAPAAPVEPRLQSEWERRRLFYLEQGMSPEEAEAQVQAELTPRPKTGHDNVRDYLRQREQERAAQEQEHQRWLERSDALDREREEAQRQERAQKRRADCEERRRVETLRQGFSRLRCEDP